MTRFLINVTTNWCGMDQTYRAMAEKESDLWDLADELAYENFSSFDCADDIATEYGYEPSEMTDGDWDRLWEDATESDYYSGWVEEFEGDDEEWESYGGVIYEG